MSDQEYHIEIPLRLSRADMDILTEAMGLIMANHRWVRDERTIPDPRAPGAINRSISAMVVELASREIDRQKGGAK